MSPPPPHSAFGARPRRYSDADAPRNEPARERGAVTVLAIAAVALAVVLAFGVARLGNAVSDRARADTAADAAALAAAGVLARGGSAASAAAAASETASSNGARLERCDVCRTEADCRGPSRRAATGRARAEVRYECFADPTRC